MSNPKITTQNSTPRSVWLIFSYLAARIVFVILLSLSGYSSSQHVSNHTALAFAMAIVTIVKLALPVALLILLLRRRYAFLTIVAIFAGLDGFGLLQMAQSLFSGKVHLNSLSVLDYLSALLGFLSIALAIYSNSSKVFRRYCSTTPSNDRKRILEDSRSVAGKDRKKLVGIRGWLALLSFFLCFQIIATIGLMTWFWLQVQANGGESDFAFALNSAIFLGAMFYVFPLISLIRLVKKRLDFRNSYVIGAVIDTVMFLIIFVVPDGKMFYPVVPYLFIGVVLMIVFGLYLFRSKRVILSCPNGKPDKGARIDAYKWRKLY